MTRMRSASSLALSAWLDYNRRGHGRPRGVRATELLEVESTSPRMPPKLEPHFKL